MARRYKAVSTEVGSYQNEIGAGQRLATSGAQP